MIYLAIFSLTIDEVLHLLKKEDNENQELEDESEEIRGKDINEIVFLPPKDGADTYEDSNNDDTSNLNHLTESQLVLECEVRVNVRHENLGTKIMRVEDNQGIGRKIDGRKLTANSLNCLILRNVYKYKVLWVISCHLLYALNFA